MPEMQTEPELKRCRELKEIMDFQGPDRDTPIRYPYVCDENGNDLSETGRNEDARHVWYLKNKDAGRNRNDSVEILPGILAKIRYSILTRNQRKKDIKIITGITIRTGDGEESNMTEYNAEGYCWQGIFPYKKER